MPPLNRVVSRFTIEDAIVGELVYRVGFVELLIVVDRGNRTEQFNRPRSR